MDDLSQFPQKQHNEYNFNNSNISNHNDLEQSRYSMPTNYSNFYVKHDINQHNYATTNINNANTSYGATSEKRKRNVFAFCLIAILVLMLICNICGGFLYISSYISTLEDVDETKKQEIQQEIIDELEENKKQFFVPKSTEKIDFLFEE